MVHICSLKHLFPLYSPKLSHKLHNVCFTYVSTSRTRARTFPETRGLHGTPSPSRSYFTTQLSCVKATVWQWGEYWLGLVWLTVQSRVHGWSLCHSFWYFITCWCVWSGLFCGFTFQLGCKLVKFRPWPTFLLSLWCQVEPSIWPYLLQINLQHSTTYRPIFRWSQRWKT